MKIQFEDEIIIDLPDYGEARLPPGTYETLRGNQGVYRDIVEEPGEYTHARYIEIFPKHEESSEILNENFGWIYFEREQGSIVDLNRDQWQIRSNYFSPEELTKKDFNKLFQSIRNPSRKPETIFRK